MKILRNINSLKKKINNIKKLGFVPTMGGLHRGHLSLIKKSKRKSNRTLVSIYVNPYQFNNKQDFKRYPRNINKDLKLLKKLKVDFVFIPKTQDIYKKKRSKRIIISNKKNIMCGKFRKGHFESVIDIVDRLLNIINPKYMFLGEKDFQQFFLIKKYFKNKFKVIIIPCKTIREKNYLAFSSRNKLLSKNQFKIAGKIAKKLKKFKKKIKNKHGLNRKINKFKMYLKNTYKIKIDYLEIRNEKNLSIYKNNRKFRLFIAYYMGNIRLIDNF